MVKTLFIILLTIHLALILIDTVRNFASLFPADFMIKVIPLALMVILALMDILFCDDDSWSIRLPSYLLASNAIAMNIPSSFEKPKGFIICSAVAFVFFLAFFLLDLTGFGWLEPDVLPLVIPALVFIQSVFNRQDNDIITSLDLPLVLDMVPALILYLCAEGRAEGHWQLPAVSFALYALLIYMSVKKFVGGFYWLIKKTQPRIMSPVYPDTFKALNDGSRMDEMYARLEKLMADEQPYLRDDLTQAELARIMLTNKTYLSRTINQKSGKNYCTYINWYRINYALKIIEKDTRVKVVELAVMSGFHTVASFNMAFRLFMGDTPSEYIRTQRAKTLSSAQIPFHDAGTGART